MTCIPNTFHAEFTRVVANQDSAGATRLASVVKAALAAGTCRGFEPDLAALEAIALGKAYASPGKIGGLGEFAKGFPLTPGLPEPLQGRARVATAMLKAAATPGDVDKALVAGDGLLADIAVHRAFVSSLTPQFGKKMSVAR